MKTRNGFSFVELSVAVVAVGLLAGGVMTGLAQVRSAEMQSIVVDYSRYAEAANSFKQKYGAYPGDLRKATHYWGFQNARGCANNTRADINTTDGVCDGNGNGKIETPTNADDSGEIYQFWRQLVAAKFLEGKYTGTAGPAGRFDSLIDINVPKTRLRGVGVSVLYRNPGGVAATGTNAYREPYANFGNHFRIDTKNGINLTAAEFITPAEMANIDRKMDDGKPLAGHIMPRFIYGTTAADPACTDAPFSLAIPKKGDPFMIGPGNRAYNANYKVTIPAQVCQLSARFD